MSQIQFELFQRRKSILSFFWREHICAHLINAFRVCFTEGPHAIVLLRVTKPSDPEAYFEWFITFIINVIWKFASAICWGWRTSTRTIFWLKHMVQLIGQFLTGRNRFLKDSLETIFWIKHNPTNWILFYWKKSFVEQIPSKRQTFQKVLFICIFRSHYVVWFNFTFICIF